MGKNTCNGGGTIIYAGGYFGGGRGRDVKQEGSDTPGSAKPGSICDFRAIDPKKIEEERQLKIRLQKQKESIHRARGLKDRTSKAVKRIESEIKQLNDLLIAAKINHTCLLESAKMCSTLDPSFPDSSAMSRIDDILRHHAQFNLEKRTEPKDRAVRSKQQIMPNAGGRVLRLRLGMVNVWAGCSLNKFLRPWYRPHDQLVRALRIQFDSPATFDTKDSYP